MSKSEKYWYLDILIRSGEYEFNSKSVHVGDFDAEGYVRDFYGEGGEEEDGEYLFNGGEIACSIYSLQEITKSEYEVLKKFI